MGVINRTLFELSVREVGQRAADTGTTHQELEYVADRASSRFRIPLLAPPIIAAGAIIAFGNDVLLAPTEDALRGAIAVDNCRPAYESPDSLRVQRELQSGELGRRVGSVQMTDCVVAGNSTQHFVVEIDDGGKSFRVLAPWDEFDAPVGQLTQIADTVSAIGRSNFPDDLTFSMREAADAAETPSEERNRRVVKYAAAIGAFYLGGEWLTRRRVGAVTRAMNKYINDRVTHNRGSRA